MDANERFEKLADEFYNETGYMAPGKDVPANDWQVDPSESQAVWNVWTKQHAEITRLQKLLGEAADDLERWGYEGTECNEDVLQLDIKKYRDASKGTTP